MNPPLIQAIPGMIPSGFCPTGADFLQQINVAIINGAQFTLNPAYTFFNYGNVAPTPENRVYPWIRTDGSGNFDRLYNWSTGAGSWVCPNPVPPSDTSRRIWVGNPGDIDAYDGGEAGTPLIYTGPMWAIDTAFAAKFPVGVGTFAGGSSVAVNGTGGEDQHALTQAELPAHSHTIGSDQVSDVQVVGSAVVTLDVLHSSPNSVVVSTGPDYTTSSVGNGDAITNLPPYIGVYFIKRTIRQFYTV